MKGGHSMDGIILWLLLKSFSFFGDAGFLSSAVSAHVGKIEDERPPALHISH